jgi:hypothetical protein
MATALMATAWVAAAWVAADAGAMYAASTVARVAATVAAARVRPGVRRRMDFLLSRGCRMGLCGLSPMKLGITFVD